MENGSYKESAHYTGIQKLTAINKKHFIERIRIKIFQNGNLE